MYIYRYLLCYYSKSSTYLVSDAGEAIATVRGLLSNSVAKDYWLSWAADEVKFGTGKVLGANTVVNYTDPSPFASPQFIYVTSRGRGGDWVLKNLYLSGTNTTV